MSEKTQSDGFQKEYFEKQISERCEVMRLVSLQITHAEMQIAQAEMQLESLKMGKDSLLRIYGEHQGELRKTVDLTKKMLNLEGEWACAIDQGKLVPPDSLTLPKKSFPTDSLEEKMEK